MLHQQISLCFWMTAEADIKKVRVTEAATACDILIANAEKESI